MDTQSEQLTRRQFLKEVTRATAAVAASAGLGSALAPLIACAGEAPRSLLPGFRITATARFMSTRSASRKESR